MNSFLKLISELGRGRCLDEVSEEYEKMVEAVRETGVGGAISLTIKVKPYKGDDTAMEITDVIKVTLPKAPKPPSLMYASPAGGLSTRDPRQPDLPFRPKPVGQSEITDHDPETGEIING